MYVCLIQTCIPIHTYPEKWKSFHVGNCTLRYMTSSYSCSSTFRNSLELDNIFIRRKDTRATVSAAPTKPTILYVFIHSFLAFILIRFSTLYTFVANAVIRLTFAWFLFSSLFPECVHCCKHILHHDVAAISSYSSYIAGDALLLHG